MTGQRKLLLTGGTGFIGRHVATMAAASGYEVQFLGRTAPPGATRFRAADLRDLASVRRAVAEAQPEVVVHLAAGGVAYGTGALSDLLTVNGAGTAALLEACAELPSPPPVLLAGSGFEYRPAPVPHREDDPPDCSGPYALSKTVATEAARVLSGRVPVTVLRLFGVYGPGERSPRLVPWVVERARAGRPVELTSGEQVRDYTYVQDVAEAFLRFADLPGPSGLRVVNLGSGKAMSLRTFVEALAEVLRRHGLHPDLRFGAKPQRPDERPVYVADVELLRKTTGWVPSTPLERGLEWTVEAMLASSR